MAEQPPQRTSHKGPLTPRNRKYVIAILLALLGFLMLVIVNTVQRFPQVWLYIILLDLHFHLSRLELAVAGVMAALGVAIGMVRKGDVTPLFRTATYIIFGTMLLQSAIGGAMYLQGGRPAQDVHYIYGMASVLALPFFIFVEVTAKKRPAMGSYIWGFTLLLGVIIRSIMTG